MVSRRRLSPSASGRPGLLRRVSACFLFCVAALWVGWLLWGPRGHWGGIGLLTQIRSLVASWRLGGNGVDQRLMGGAILSPYVAPVHAKGFDFDPNATLPERLYVTDLEEDHGYPVAVAHDRRDLGRMNLVEKPGDVCWAIQLTRDRLPMLESSLERWRGPVAAVMYSANVTEDLLAVRNSRVLEGARDQVRFYFVPSSPGPYPVNLLRNVAVRKCPTEYVLQVDVDFQCTKDMYATIVSLLPKWHAEVRDTLAEHPEPADQKVAFVLPAFEMKDKAAPIPDTRDEVVAGVPHIIDQVHNVTGLAIAHSATRYDLWLGAKSADELYPISYRLPFEPYYVVRKRLLPPHDVRLAGYGNDKVGQPYEMSLAGFKFFGTACCYLVHQWHPPGAWKHGSKSAWENRWDDFKFDVALRYEPKAPRNQSLPAYLHPTVAKVGEPCQSACARDHRVCDATLVDQINYCDTMRAHFQCKTCFAGNMGTDLPAVDIRSGQCNLNQPDADIVFRCDGQHPHTSRLCPCRG